MDPKNQQPEQPQSSSTVPVGQGFSAAFGAPLPPKPNTPSTPEENKEPHENLASDSVTETKAPSTENPLPTEQTSPSSIPDASPTPDLPLATPSESPVSPASPADGPTSPAGGPVVYSAVPGGMPPVKKNRSMVIAGLIVFLVLIGLILVGLVFYQNYMKQFTTPPTQEVVQPTAIPTPPVTETASPSGTLESGDSALDQQGDAVDENLNQLQQDVTDADKSASDTPDTLQ